MYNQTQALAAAMMGRDPDTIDDWDEFENEFINKYNVWSLADIEDIAYDLLSLVMPQRSSLSGTLQQIFATESEPGVWTAIVKRNYKPPVPQT